MHAAQCSICRHVQRMEIERAFLDWKSPRDIAREYDLGSHTTVYRHAHALGMFDRRQRTLEMALGRLIEQVGDVKPTASSIISAIRLMAKINAKRECVEEAASSEAHDSPNPSGQEPDNHAPASAAPAATQAHGNGETRKQAAKDHYNGPPIAFAQNAGPRRNFFWR